MARSRRTRGGLGGALGGAEIRGTLGTLIRTTLAQAGAVKDVLERGAREGRARLDDARLERRHEEALAGLGEVVLELVRRGDLADLEDVPAIADAIAAIEDVEVRLDDVHDRRGPRTRAGARGRGGRGAAGPARGRDAADAADAADADADAELPPPRRAGRPAAAGSGAVSSRDWTPPRAARPARVWRPNAADEVTRDLGPRPAEPGAAGAAAPEPGAAFREDAARRPRAGGISFERRDETGPDPDDDLADYMHPDDVEPKGE